MAYIDIISLADAKNYLRVDDDLTADDSQITLMIDAAFKYIENYTNVICVAAPKTYLFVNGCARVYDYPIGAVTAPTENLTTENKVLYVIYTTTDSETLSLEATVGFSNPTEVPSDLILVAYTLIEMYYYQKQTGNKAVLDAASITTLDQHKRFFL